MRPPRMWKSAAWRVRTQRCQGAPNQRARARPEVAAANRHWMGREPECATVSPCTDYVAPDSLTSSGPAMVGPGGRRRRCELRHGLALGLLLMRSRLGLCATFLANRRLPVYIHHCVYEYQILHCVVFMKALTVGFTTDESSLCDQVQRCDFCWRRLLSYAQL